MKKTFDQIAFIGSQHLINKVAKQISGSFSEFHCFYFDHFDESLETFKRKISILNNKKRILFIIIADLTIVAERFIHEKCTTIGCSLPLLYYVAVKNADKTINISSMAKIIPAASKKWKVLYYPLYPVYLVNMKFANEKFEHSQLHRLFPFSGYLSDGFDWSAKAEYLLIFWKKKVHFSCKDAGVHFNIDSFFVNIQQVYTWKAPDIASLTDLSKEQETWTSELLSCLRMMCPHSSIDTKLPPFVIDVALLNSVKGILEQQNFQTEARPPESCVSLAVFLGNTQINKKIAEYVDSSLITCKFINFDSFSEWENILKKFYEFTVSTNIIFFIAADISLYGRKDKYRHCTLKDCNPIINCIDFSSRLCMDEINDFIQLSKFIAMRSTQWKCIFLPLHPCILIFEGNVFDEAFHSLVHDAASSFDYISNVKYLGFANSLIVKWNSLVSESFEKNLTSYAEFANFYNSKDIEFFTWKRDLDSNKSIKDETCDSEKELSFSQRTWKHEFSSFIKSIISTNMLFGPKKSASDKLSQILIEEKAPSLDNETKGRHQTSRIVILGGSYATTKISFYVNPAQCQSIAFNYYHSKWETLFSKIDSFDQSESIFFLIIGDVSTICHVFGHETCEDKSCDPKITCLTGKMSLNINEIKKDFCYLENYIAGKSTKWTPLFLPLHPSTLLGFSDDEDFHNLLHSNFNSFDYLTRGALNIQMTRHFSSEWKSMVRESFKKYLNETAYVNEFGQYKGDSYYWKAVDGLKILPDSKQAKLINRIRCLSQSQKAWKNGLNVLMEKLFNIRDLTIQRKKVEHHVAMHSLRSTQDSSDIGNSNVTSHLRTSEENQSIWTALNLQEEIDLSSQSKIRRSISPLQEQHRRSRSISPVRHHFRSQTPESQSPITRRLTHSSHNYLMSASNLHMRSRSPPGHHSLNSRRLPSPTYEHHMQELMPRSRSRSPMRHHLFSSQRLSSPTHEHLMRELRSRSRSRSISPLISRRLPSPTHEHLIRKFRPRSRSISPLISRKLPSPTHEHLMRKLIRSRSRSGSISPLISRRLPSPTHEHLMRKFKPRSRSRSISPLISRRLHFPIHELMRECRSHTRSRSPSLHQSSSSRNLPSPTHELNMKGLRRSKSPLGHQSSSSRRLQHPTHHHGTRKDRHNTRSKSPSGSHSSIPKKTGHRDSRRGHHSHSRLRSPSDYDRNKSTMKDMRRLSPVDHSPKRSKIKDRLSLPDQDRLKTKYHNEDHDTPHHRRVSISQIRSSSRSPEFDADKYYHMYMKRVLMNSGSSSRSATTEHVEKTTSRSCHLRRSRDDDGHYRCEYKSQARGTTHSRSHHGADERLDDRTLLRDKLERDDHYDDRPKRKTSIFSRLEYPGNLH